MNRSKGKLLFLTSTALLGLFYVVITVYAATTSATSTTSGYKWQTYCALNWRTWHNATIVADAGGSQGNFSYFNKQWKKNYTSGQWDLWDHDEDVTAWNYPNAGTYNINETLLTNKGSASGNMKVYGNASADPDDMNPGLSLTGPEYHYMIGCGY